MPTVNLTLVTSKNPANIYLRFVNGRKQNFYRATGIMVDPKFWNPKAQQIKNVIAVPNRDEINSKLSRLKIEILDAYNLAHMNGEVISAVWLESEINKYFKRPKGEVKKTNLERNLYLSDFADYWLEEKSSKWKVKAGKYLDDKTKAHYKILVDNIKRFEGKNKLRLRDITSDVLDRFAEFLNNEGYAYATAKRMIGRFKFFCERAVAENLEVNMNYKARVFIKEEEEDYKKAYLNEQEITKLFKHDFSYNESLDNARDNFVIALLTALRVSDFLRALDVSNFEDGYIHIKTQKTGTRVTIPVHRYIEAILEKRNGQLPRKISDQRFNDYIKNICQVLEFDELIMGGLVQTDENGKKRKKIGMYPKYLLISSHSGRRSFATNNFGKIPNADLCAICGWSSESQMLEYIQKSNKDAADNLKRHWESIEK